LILANNAKGPSKLQLELHSGKTLNDWKVPGVDKPGAIEDDTFKKYKNKIKNFEIILFPFFFTSSCKNKMNDK
jgi:hypothetical protein